MTQVYLDLQDKQIECYNLLCKEDGPQFVYYGGAKFGGKSHFSREWIHSRRLQYPYTNGALIRSTYEEVYQNHVLPMLEAHPELNEYYNKTDNAVFYPNGSKLFFKYCDSEEDARSSFWGVQFPDMAMDEAGDHQEQEFKILKLSNRIDPMVKKRFPKFKPKFLLTGNPGGIGHAWCQRIFVDKQFTPNEKPEQYGFVQAFLQDNPKGVEANPEYESNLRDLPDDMVQAWLYGRWDVFAGQFFKGWKAIPTVPLQTLGLVSVYAGLDWGKRDAASSHLIAVTPHGRHVVFSEVYVTGGSPGSFAKICADKRGSFKVEETFADPSVWAKDQYGREVQASGAVVDYKPATSFSIADQIEDAGGFKLTRANNDRISGWMRMQSLMERGQLEIMECCPNLISELKYAVYNKRLLGKREDLDGNCKDHALDDVRYCLMHTRIPKVPNLGPTDFEHRVNRLAKKNNNFVYGMN